MQQINWINSSLAFALEDHSTSSSSMVFIYLINQKCLLFQASSAPNAIAKYVPQFRILSWISYHYDALVKTIEHFHRRMQIQYLIASTKNNKHPIILFTKLVSPIISDLFWPKTRIKDAFIFVLRLSRAYNLYFFSPFLLFMMVVDKYEHYFRYLHLPFLGFSRGSSRIRWCRGLAIRY